MIYFVISLLIIAIILYTVEKKKNKEKNKEIKEAKEIEEVTEIKDERINLEEVPYRKRLLLTKNEWYFYKELKPIADEMNLTVLSKIRLADLIEVDNTKINRKDFQKYFNRINRKHVDFALAKKENLRIVMIIELDDNSHNKEQNERDEFFNKVLEKTGYKVLRTRGTGELKEKIQEKVM